MTELAWEFARVFDRVVVGDCDVLSSVQALSSFSSSPMSKCTVGCSGGGLCRVAFPGFISDRFGGATSLFDDFSMVLACRGRWPLEWFFFRVVCDVFRTMPIEDAFRFTCGRGLLLCGVEFPESERR
jgi:hypothetical protein